MRIYRDRSEAGRLLSGRLEKYVNGQNICVFALPRGGVPVAFEVAKALRCPLDVFLVRKLGTPGQEELAMGAISMGAGAVELNEDVIRMLGITDAEIERVKKKETEELRRRHQLYSGKKDMPDLNGQTVILVDDGIATGATMRAAITGVKQLGAQKVIVATPVAPPSTVESISREVDEMICLDAPEPFFAIGAFYDDFRQLTDEEVKSLLARASEQYAEGVGDEKRESA